MDNALALKKIAEQIRTDETATLRKGATNAVPGDGNPFAEIVFVGEGPGEQEDKQGKPFVGAAGKFLDELLASINLRREDIFITNIVKWRPPHNRDPLPEEISHAWPYLRAQLEVIKPKIVILLGRHAMNRFLPNLRISEVHGKPKRYKGQVYLPLYHPAAALYKGDLRKVLLEDFSRIPSIIATVKSLPPQQIEYENPSEVAVSVSSIPKKRQTNLFE